MAKDILVCLCNWVLFNNKKKWSIYGCNNMNDFQNHYMEGKESDKREYRLYGFICKNSCNYKIL